MDQQLARSLKRIGATIKALRRSRELTQEDVADLLGIVPRQFQKIESGKVNVTMRTLIRVAKVLSVQPKDLL